MKDPARLLDASASELEQRLLRAGASEQPPAAAMQRLADQLGVSAPASEPMTPATSSQLPLAAASKTGLIAAGLAGLGITLAAVGWVATLDSSDHPRDAAATAPARAAESRATDIAPSPPAAQQPTAASPEVRSATHAKAPLGASDTSSPGQRAADGAAASAHGAGTIPAGGPGRGATDGAAATSARGVSARPSSGLRQTSSDGAAPTRHGGSEQPSSGSGRAAADGAATTWARGVSARTSGDVPRAAVVGAGASPRGGTADTGRVAADDSAAPAETARASESAAPDDGSAPVQPLLAQEIARIDAVRRQLAASRPKPALAALRAYRHDFPSGVLRQEAELLTIEAYGQAGERDHARTLGARFLARNPDSPHSARVRDLLETLGPDAR